jgi:hypothetical protein
MLGFISIVFVLLYICLALLLVIKCNFLFK